MLEFEVEVSNVLITTLLQIAQQSSEYLNLVTPFQNYTFHVWEFIFQTPKELYTLRQTGW